MTTWDEDQDLSLQPDPYRDGRVHVMSDKCSTCVFHPGNRMNLSPGRLKGMTDHVQESGVVFSCHQTLPYSGAKHREHYGGSALCAGAMEAYGDRSPQIQLALAMDVVTYVDPAPSE